MGGTGSPYGRAVERDLAIDQLAPAYARAIRLDDGGADVDEIAAALGATPEAVPALLQIGKAKLAALLLDTPPG